MNSKAQYFTGLAMAAMAAPAAADIIYGSLQQTIPTDYTGVTVTVGAGTLNPFFGGAGVANNNALQPFRMTNTGGLATIKNFATGVTIDSVSEFLATGAGGSTDHVGTTFTAGTEGYVGFKLDAANYGWMRVVLTNNTSTPVTPMIKDWAYDNTGAAIKTGWINTDIVSPTAQTVTLNPGTSEAFTLGSVLADASGSITNSVLKTGAGTTTLKGTNTYTGATAVNAGTLVVGVAGVGSITSNVTVASTAALGGSGTITGNVTLSAESATGLKDGGKLAPGNSPGVLTAAGTTTLNTGSIFSWAIGTDIGGGVRGTEYAGLNTASVSGSNAVFQIVTDDSEGFADTFWTINRTWTDIFKNADGTTSLANNWSSVFSSFAYSDGANPITDVATYGSFSWTTSGNTLSWTAVPEPTSALAGLLLVAGLLRRRRKIRKGVGTRGLACPTFPRG